jgi:hypothetical protein
MPLLPSSLLLFLLLKKKKSQPSHGEDGLDWPIATEDRLMDMMMVAAMVVVGNLLQEQPSFLLYKEEEEECCHWYKLQKLKFKNFNKKKTN